MAMAASIECGFRFENALGGFGIHLPRRSKLRDGQRKWVVKQAAEKWLPARSCTPQARLSDARRVRRRQRALLHGGVASELLHWSQRVQQAIIPRARHHEGLRFALVGLELWGRLYLRGEKPDALASELLALA
jgi:hypothetical protein